MSENNHQKQRGRGFYNVREYKVQEGIKILKDAKCLDGTADQKFTFLFCDLKKHRDGYLFKEICLIMHPDEYEINPVTGERVPTFSNYMKTRQKLQDYRKNRNLDSGVIIYCLWNEELKLELYFNISTMQLIEQVEKKGDRIIKGIKRNIKNAKKFIKLPSKLKRQLSRTARNQLRQQIIEKIQREQAAKRKKEMEEQIYA
jgi:hypothetical protein